MYRIHRAEAKHARRTASKGIASWHARRVKIIDHGASVTHSLVAPLESGLIHTQS